MSSDIKRAINQIGTLLRISKPLHVSGVTAKNENVGSPLVRSPIPVLILVPLGFVYRFVCTGSIEEKIFQRQASKQSLSASMIDNNALPSGDQLVFSTQDLRKLFLFKGHQTVCETHETFKCKRCKGGKQQVKAQAMLYGDPST